MFAPGNLANVWQLKTDSDLETMTLTDQVVGDEFTPRTTRELLNRISKDLLIILGASM